MHHQDSNGTTYWKTYISTMSKVGNGLKNILKTLFKWIEASNSAVTTNSGLRKLSLDILALVRKSLFKLPDVVIRGVTFQTIDKGFQPIPSPLFGNIALFRVPEGTSKATFLNIVEAFTKLFGCHRTHTSASDSEFWS